MCVVRGTVLRGSTTVDDSKGKDFHKIEVLRKRGRRKTITWTL